MSSSQPETFFKSFSIKTKTPLWQVFVPHFGSENEKEQLKKHPVCEEILKIQSSQIQYIVPLFELWCVAGKLTKVHRLRYCCYQICFKHSIIQFHLERSRMKFFETYKHITSKYWMYMAWHGCIWKNTLWKDVDVFDHSGACLKQNHFFFLSET